jgi:iron complex outermembrane receptor protein
VVVEEHTGSTARINGERLRQSVNQLGDVLASETGVQQRQSGGFGTFASVSVRAASSAQTSVYLDGVLLNSGSQAVIDLSTLELLNLDSVDIYRGTSPLQLSRGSIGGEVNLNSANSAGQSGTRLRASAGSFGLRGRQLAHQGSSRQWNWIVSASEMKSDNDFEFVNDNTTPLNPNDDELQQRNNGQAERSGLLLKTHYRPASRYRTDFTLQSSSRELGVPERRNRKDNRAELETDNLQMQLSQVIDDLSIWNTRHTLYRHSDNSKFDDRLNQIGLAAQDIRSDAGTLGVKTYWETFTNAGTVGLSLDYRQESLESVDAFSANDSYEAERRNLLAATHLAWLDTSERWTVVPALRWNRIKSQAVNDPASSSAISENSSRSDVSLQLGVAWKYKPTIIISSNAGNYFREPSFGELYGSIGLINGNPELLAEQGSNLDLGVSYQQESFQLAVTGFLSQRDELIVTSFDARGIGRPVNTGEAVVKGIELSLHWKLRPNLQLSANATLQDPRNRDAFAGFTNKVLPGEARQSYFARIQSKPSRIAYWYEWQATRDRFYDSANLLRAANTSVHSIGLDWQNKSWQLGARVQNLGNSNVEDFNGFPKPGRSWSLAVTRML